MDGISKVFKHINSMKFVKRKIIKHRDKYKNVKKKICTRAWKT